MTTANRQPRITELQRSINMMQLGLNAAKTHMAKANSLEDRVKFQGDIDFYTDNLIELKERLMGAVGDVITSHIGICDEIRINMAITILKGKNKADRLSGSMLELLEIYAERMMPVCDNVIHDIEKYQTLTDVENYIKMSDNNGEHDITTNI